MGVRLDPTKTAVIVIDIQRDFCSSEGFAARTWQHDVSHLNGIIEKIKIFISKIQELGVDVLYTKLIYDPDKVSKAIAKKLQKIRSFFRTVCST